MNIKTLATSVLLLFTTISCVAGEGDKSADKDAVATDAVATDAVVERDVSSEKSMLGKDSNWIYREMGALSDNKYCESNADCGAMPAGERSCGGPSNYIVYSRLIGEESVAQLASLAQRSKELAQKMNLKKQMMGICQILPAVTAECANNQCVAVSVTDGSTGGPVFNSNDGLVD